MGVHLEDLYEEWDDEVVPEVDKIDPGELTPLQQEWRTNGHVILPGFIAEPLIGSYSREWMVDNGDYSSDNEDARLRHARPKGWPECTPYMSHSALRQLCCWGPLARVLEETIGEPMGVHLNLTGWVSTERDWHSDQYLNPPGVGGYYAAVWIALDDIDPDSGPFQLIPGSHLWPPLSQEKVMATLEEHERGPDWPRISERILSPLFEERLQEEGVEPWSFIAKRGDVLIWHGRLVHRGSRPNDPTLERRSLIAHFSGVNHRADMPAAVQHYKAGWFFPIDGGPV